MENEKSYLRKMGNPTLDTSVAPFGTPRLQHIINCVEHLGDTIEASYLEIKSSLDLQTPRAIAKIAKFLLGAANRLPRQAIEHFQGYAVMIVGADRGQAKGIPRDLEKHEVEEKLRKYLGAEFPPFDIARIPVDNHHDIWFFISPPPKDGDTLFPCHKPYTSDDRNDRKDTLMDGAIYVRNHTQTKPATASHILALVERARGGKHPPADLDLHIKGAIHRVVNVDRVMKGVFEFQETQFNKSLEVAKSSSELRPLLASFQQSRPSTDEQKINAYNKWHNTRDQYYTDGLDYLLGTILYSSGISVTSHGRNITKPRLELTFHGCEAFEPRNRFRPHLDKIVPPVLRQKSPLGLSAEEFELDYPLASNDADWKNTDNNTVIVFTPESFRPDTPWHSEAFEIVLSARDPEATSISVSWKLTEANSDEVSKGEFTVATSSPANGLTLFKSKFLDPLQDQ